MPILKTKTKIAVILSKFQVADIPSKMDEKLTEIMEDYDEMFAIIQTSQIPFTSAYPLDVRNILNMLEDIDEPITGWVAIEEGNTEAVFAKRVRDYMRAVSSPRNAYEITYFNFDSKMPKADDVINMSRVYESAEISDVPLDNAVYRQGIIDGASQGYASDIAVVDIAAITEDGRIVLGRKPDDTKYRFPGGFCDTNDESAEVTVHRELREETGICTAKSRAGKTSYVCSHLTNDYRKREDKDKVLTFLYHVPIKNEVEMKAADDLTFVELVPLDEVNPEDMIPGHEILMTELKNHFGHVKSPKSGKS